MMVHPDQEKESAVRDSTRVTGWGRAGVRRTRADAPAEPDSVKTPQLRSPRRRRLYLANAFGFSAGDRYALDRLRAELDALGADVWEPFSECSGLSARDAGLRRLAGIRECDGMFAVVNGSPPDGCVMVEIGYAFSQGKPVFLFRDDTRVCSDAADYPLNTMAFAGLPDDWRTHWYTGVDKLGDSEGALARWLDGGE